MEERPCARCGDPFRVNPRAGKTHRYCSKDDCQGERCRVAQRDRRARDGRPPLSETGRKSHAAYMKSYRQTRRRKRSAVVDACVREAGSTGDPATIYVVPGRGPGLRLRVVTEAGLDVIFDTAKASGGSLSVVTEAG